MESVYTLSSIRLTISSIFTHNLQLIFVTMSSQYLISQISKPFGSSVLSLIATGTSSVTRLKSLIPLREFNLSRQTLQKLSNFSKRLLTLQLHNQKRVFLPNHSESRLTYMLSWQVPLTITRGRQMVFHL